MRSSHKLSSIRKFSYTLIFLSWSLTHKNWISNSHLQILYCILVFFLLLALSVAYFILLTLLSFPFQFLPQCWKTPPDWSSFGWNVLNLQKMFVFVSVHVEMKLMSITAVSNGAVWQLISWCQRDSSRILRREHHSSVYRVLPRWSRKDEKNSWEALRRNLQNPTTGEQGLLIFQSFSVLAEDYSLVWIFSYIVLLANGLTAQQNLAVWDVM